jgi:hypothetical protein
MRGVTIALALTGLLGCRQDAAPAEPAAGHTAAESAEAVQPKDNGVVLDGTATVNLVAGFTAPGSTPGEGNGTLTATIVCPLPDGWQVRRVKGAATVESSEGNWKWSGPVEWSGDEIARGEVRFAKLIPYNADDASHRWVGEQPREIPARVRLELVTFADETTRTFE